MTREQLVDVARRGVEHWRAGTGSQEADVFRVPAANYVDQRHFELEMERIFKRVPIVLGFSTELRDPGSYLAMTVAGVPVLLVRGSDGSVRAFLNICSHRGAQVVGEGCGTARRFACPYHGWAYDTRGDLVGIFEASAFGEVDRSGLGLMPLPVAERAGLIWGVLSPRATIDIDTFLCGYDALLEHLDFEQCHVVGRRALAGPNWKVAYDGYLDFYHLPILHKATFGPQFSPKAVYHEWGPHQRVISPGRAFSALAELPEDEWPTAEMLGGVWTIFPHVSVAAFDACGKMYQVSQLFPGPTVGESTTIQTYLHTLPPDEERAAAIAERIDFLGRVVRDEDYATGLRLQTSLATGTKAEVLFGRNEGGGQRFHRWVQAILETDDADLSVLFSDTGATNAGHASGMPAVHFPMPS